MKVQKGVQQAPANKCIANYHKTIENYSRCFNSLLPS